MAQKVIKSIITRVLFVILFITFVSFFCCEYSYAASATPSDLTKSLDESEIEEVEDYSDLQEMVGQIFEINTNMGTDDLSDPIKLMFSLVSRILVYWDNDFVHSSLYHLLVGLALIFLVANFSIKMYEESSAGLELKVNSSLMLKNMCSSYLPF